MLKEKPSVKKRIRGWMKRLSSANSNENKSSVRKKPKKDKRKSRKGKNGSKR